MLLSSLCCAACSPGGGAGEERGGPRLGEEQATARAAEMLDSRPAPPASDRDQLGRASPR